MKQQSKESHRQKMQQRLRQIYERRQSQSQPFEGISALELFHAERSQQDRHSIVRYLRSRHKHTFDELKIPPADHGAVDPRLEALINDPSTDDDDVITILRAEFDPEYGK